MASQQKIDFSLLHQAVERAKGKVEVAQAAEEKLIATHVSKHASPPEIGEKTPPILPPSDKCLPVTLQGFNWPTDALNANRDAVLRLISAPVVCENAITPELALLFDFGFWIELLASRNEVVGDSGGLFKNITPEILITHLHNCLLYAQRQAEKRLNAVQTQTPASVEANTEKITQNTSNDAITKNRNTATTDEAACAGWEYAREQYFWLWQTFLCLYVEPEQPEFDFFCDLIKASPCAAHLKIVGNCISTYAGHQVEDRARFLDRLRQVATDRLAKVKGKTCKTCTCGRAE